MGVLLFSINLDNPSRQYSPGQVVTGKLYLTITGEETTLEVVLRFFGEGHTHWVEVEHRRHGMDDEEEEIHHDYVGHETYFNFYLRLYGDGSNKLPIPPGENVFPFVFQVPIRPLPVTCNFENGSICYGLEARIRKPWYKFDPKTEVLPITVFTLTDLNMTPAAGNPMQVIDAKQFGCCCCCRTQPCVIQSFTPKLGYCPGEMIPLTVEVKNYSDQQIFNVTVALAQVWTLYADGYEGRHSRTHPVELQLAVGPGMAPGQCIRWDVPGLVVPLTVPPTPNPMASDLFKMEYEIHVNASTKGCCCGRHHFGITHPIIVGNVPLMVPVAVEMVKETSSAHKDVQKGKQNK